MSAALGIAMILGGVLFFTTTLAYAFGKHQSAGDIDDTFEIAKALGAYGVFVRLEAEALGITVEELVARDAALTRAAVSEAERVGYGNALAAMRGDEIVANVHRANARRLGEST